MISLFYGKQHHTQVTPINFHSLEPNWVASNHCSSPHFQAVTFSSAILAQNLRTGLVCLADAYISNKKELLTRLACDENEARLWSDAELILACYERWGIRCLDYLCGDFVFAIWDPTTQQFFLVRDPMGYRSIFYHITRNGGVYFSNTVKLLIEQLEVSTEINRQKVASFLTLLIEDGNMTYYKDISKVPAGFYLQCSAQSAPVLKRYWNADDFLNDPLILNHEEDYYDHFRSLFAQVVQSYIPAHDSIASHLSGGLDSSSVSAIAAKYLQENNRTLTTFGHVPFYPNATPPLKRWSYCDRIYMEEFSKQYSNTTHHFINQPDPSSFTYRFQSWLDQPAINPWNMSWWMGCVIKAHDLNIKTILIGQGGNMTISWPNSPIINPGWRLRSSLSAIKEHCINKLQRSPWKEYSAVHSRFARETKLSYYYAKDEQCIDSNDSRAYYLNNNVMDYAATIFTPMRHLYHVEHYDPTLDRRIVEFCLRIPLSIFQNTTTSRLLVRKGLSDLLPKSISERTERGMQSADWYMLFEQNKSIYRDYLYHWRNTHVAEYLDIKHLLKLLEKWDYRKVQQSQGQVYKAFVNQYQLKFLRAIETGLFLDKNCFSNKRFNCHI